MALLDFTGAPHGGSQRHLPEWQSQPRITPTTIIDHSIVGTGEGAWNYFHDKTAIESHFIVCGAGDRDDGWIWQLMDTDREGDANNLANAYAISIETGDQGNPDVQPWTARQLASLIWLHRELRRVHPTIPNRRSISCADPAGHGYHTMHGAPSCWTPYAKTCPGTIRKRQWVETLLQAYLGGEDEMPILDADVDRIAAAVNAKLTETMRVGFAGSKDRPIRAWAVQLEQLRTFAEDDEAHVLAACQAVQETVGSSKETVLGALAAMSLHLTDEQVASLAGQLHVDVDECARAVRLELARGLTE